MGTPQKRIVIVAGEASGDMRAAGLVKAIQAACPGVQLTGVGGKHMAEAGVKLLADIDQLGVVGIWEVIKHLPVIKKVFDLVIGHASKEKPDAAILVDYPGFNLRLAKAFKKMGIKVIYYVSPQVWAWKEKRVEQIKQSVDRMLVLFPFEQEVYAKYGMTVDFVGHPLLDEVKITEPPASIKAQLNLHPRLQVIGLLPGSRLKEVQRHLPVMLKAAHILAGKNPNRRFMVLKAPTIPRAMIEQEIQNSGVAALIYDGPAYNGIGAMDAVMVASGTATLETGLLLKPMVIMYKTAWPTYWLAKLFVKIPYIGLVNVVAGKKIIEEFIQDDATPQNLAAGIEKIFSDPNTYAQITNELSKVKSSLGQSGASRRAAEVVLQELKS